MRDTFRIHAAYVIGILLATNVLILTVRWGGVRDLVGYLNFGSTLTSLVLAVLAIVYAYLSNASVGQQVLTLRTATDEMRTVAGGLTSAARDLEARLDTIPNLFEEVGVKVSETHQYVHQIYETTGKKAANVEAAADGATTSTSAPDIANQMLRMGSLDGLRALYMAQIAHDEKIAFSFSDAATKINLDQQYAHGFLVSSQSCGLLDLTTKDDIWNVVAFDSNLARNLKTKLEARERESNERWASRVGMDRTMQRIEAYFADAPLPPDDPPPHRRGSDQSPS